MKDITMKKYECPDCFVEFVSGTTTAACPKCGYVCIASLPEIVDPAANGKAEEVKDTLPAVREVLQRLCMQTYDKSYQGSEWEELVDKALEELQPLMRSSN